MVRESGLGVPDGWSVVMKTDGDSTFGYDADYWTSTTNLLNEGTGVYLPGNAKYPAYNTQRLDAVMACIGTFDNCLTPYAFSVSHLPSSAFPRSKQRTHREQFAQFCSVAFALTFSSRVHQRDICKCNTYLAMFHYV